MIAPHAARVARRGAISGAIAPRSAIAPAATSGHRARQSTGPPDGETAIRYPPPNVTGPASCTGRAIPRVLPRNRAGGGPPCAHPTDAHARDPYAAGRILCLACDATWDESP